MRAIASPCETKRCAILDPIFRIVRFVSIAAVAGVVVLNTQGTPDPTSQPTFQVSVNYVDVDVTVTDAAGGFVRDFSRDDFELLEDGKPQRVDTFSLVELPIERPVRFLALGRPVQSDVRSNRDVSSGRVYILVLDDLNVSALRTTAVRKNARTFIEQNLGPHDMAAVVTTSGRKDAAQEFTSDPVLLTSAIDRFVGQRLQSAEDQRIENYYQSLLLEGLNTQTNTGQEQEQTIENPITRNMQFDPSNLERGQRAVGVLNTLENLATYLQGVRGRRKALLWFSEGIDYPMADVFDSPSGNEIFQATRDAITAAARANVNFFAIDPRGLMGLTTDFIESTKSGPPGYAGTDPTKPAGTPFSGIQALTNEMCLTQNSLRTLSEGTGGFAAVDTNDFTETFTRIVETNSRYYLLGYTPPNHPRDGRFHRIEVKVKRPGLTVVARRGYPSLPRGRTTEERRREEMNRRALETRKGGSADTSVELRSALNSPTQQPGLTFAVQAVAFKNTAKEASVALAVELQGSALEFTPQPNSLLSDTIELSFFALSDEGKAMRGTRSALNLAVRPDTYQRIRPLGIRGNSRTALAPGRYQLRVGARDPNTGQSGTVFADVLVPDFTKQPLMMSGVLLSSSLSASVFTPQGDPVAEKLLTTPPTTNREFSQNDTITWLTEVYDNLPAQQLRQITLTAKLISETGREVFSARDALSNGAAGKSWNAYSYTGRIPLTDIAPGRYLLRLEATNTAGGTPVTSETLVTVARVN